ncbi:uncharacterized protein LOC116663303 isoform X3 [Camelus ferus]|uniref:Uncharacterized protein LOC116663303 isoform X3 n=1 Tax=Camelus ferus TaxID=419612 RepID=A0A8B8SXN0_CAMFR|nr:uncharacterized protein LOC116663303 isoform X3 [Camelus ferus]
MRAPKSAQTLPGLGTGLPDGWSLPKGAGALPLAISGQQKTGFCSSCGGCGQHPPPQSSQGAGASGCHAWVGHAQSQPTPTSSLQPWGPRPHLVAQTDDVPLPGRSPTHCTGDITSRSEAATSSQRRPTSPGRAGALSMTGPPVQTLHGR